MLLTLTYHGADGKRDTVLVECPAPPPKGEGLFPASASPLRRLKCDTFSAPLNKYGDVFAGRTEYRSPPFDALRLRTEPVEVTGPSRRPSGPPQDERDLALRASLGVSGRGDGTSLSSG